jgi:ATP-dependent RNA circularization protein (DNA/RNA ligase family)
MKPIERKNYGSIPHLSNSKLGEGDYYVEKGMERILTEKKRDKHDTIFAYEKYDGSNIGIGKMNGKIFALTRSGYEAKTSQYKQHHYFSDWVYSNEKLFAEMLGEGERITGEWLLQAHGLKYKIESDPILFFDYFTQKNERLLQTDLRQITGKYGLTMPRLLSEGEPITVNELLPILNLKTKGFESEENPEGIVYRVERKGKVDFLAKYVRSDFPTGQFCINVEEQNLIWNVSPQNCG